MAAARGLMGGDRPAGEDPGTIGQITALPWQKALPYRSRALCSQARAAKAAEGAGGGAAAEGTDGAAAAAPSKKAKASPAAGEEEDEEEEAEPVLELPEELQAFTGSASDRKGQLEWRQRVQKARSKWEGEKAKWEVRGGDFAG